VLRWAVLLCLVVTAVAAEAVSIQARDGVTLRTVDGTRALTCLVFYPDGAAPCPVVVFSHDLGRSRGAYWYLGEAWAKAGLVAVFPTHARSDREAVALTGLLRAAESARATVRDGTIWRDRAVDLRTVAAGLPDIEAQVPALRGRLDADAIGIGGHAFGACTAAAAAGLKPTLSPPIGEPIDVPAAKSCLLFGPPGPWAAMEPVAWQGLGVPCLIAVGGTDPDMAAICGGQDGSEWLAEVLSGRRIPTWTLTLPKAHHCTFSNGGWGPAVDPEHIRLLTRSSIAFWRRTLQGDAAAEPDRTGP